MAETALAMILHFFRGLDFATRNQVRRRWDTGPFYDAGTPVRELSRATVGIVGFGGVGREVARRCLALGASVVAVRRTGPAEEVVELATVDGRGPAGEVTVLTGRHALEGLAARSDVLVVAVPETEATRGMIDAGVLARLPAGAVLLNLARGRVVDEDAVVVALRRGPLRGAGLDVFATEPLPPGSPLWELDGTLVTPHVSAVTDAFWERETELIADNVRRLRSGRSLRNVVDRRAGY
jgi:phosphoglycerate dehydrogenase-like enzyme